MELQHHRKLSRARTTPSVISWQIPAIRARVGGATVAAAAGLVNRRGGGGKVGARVAGAAEVG